MKTVLYKVIPSTFLSLFFVFTIPLAAASNSDEREKLFKKFRNAPAKRMENFSLDPASSLASRVQIPPMFLVKGLRDYDERYDYAAYTPTAEEKKAIEKSLALLPAATQAVLKKKLIGIYFVHNLWGGGFTDFVLDQNGELFYYIFFNPGCLRMSLADWLSAKDESNFDFDDESIRVRLEYGRNGADKTGFLYLLFHEVAHVVDYEKNLTPFVEKDTQILKGTTAKETPFTRNIWNDYKIVTPGSEFPGRTNISTYGFRGKPKIKSSEAESFYRELAKSPFISLYACLSWAEDFADLTAFQLLDNALKEPLILTLKKNDKTLFSYKPLEGEKVKARLAALGAKSP